ncbi:hypothetical protein EON63_15785 [archaeon]|nr:MAG: hypothetical protein EON63_15785 [archaeon]
MYMHFVCTLQLSIVRLLSHFFLYRRLRVLGKMDLVTYHTLMMGLIKVKAYRRALGLYEEAVMADIKVVV